MAAEDEMPETSVGPRRPPSGTGLRVLVVDVGSLINPDLAPVEALARLQLSVVGLGCSIRLCHATHELLELLALVGLGDVLSSCGELEVGRQGQTEEREQPRGVEKEVEPDDPTG